MEKKVLFEINRMRQIMRLPILNESQARLMEAAGPLPGLARFAEYLADIFTDAPRLTSIPDYTPNISWQRLGKNFSIDRESFTKVKKWLDDMASGAADHTNSLSYLAKEDITDLFKSLDKYDPTQTKQVIQGIVDEARGNQGTDQTFLTFLKQGFEEQLENPPMRVNPQGNLVPNPQRTMYEYLLSRYGDPLVAYSLDQHYQTNIKKVGTGEFVVKQKAPDATITYNLAESFYNRAMNFMPFWYEKIKQRWLISLADPTCKGILGCLWSMRGEAFRGEAEMRKLIDQRLDEIASKVASGINPVELTSDLDRVINSISNLGRFQSETLKPEFLRYIVENEYLPKSLREGFEKSEQWKLIQKAIDTDTATFIGQQIITKLGAWVGLNPIMPMITFFKNKFKGATWKEAALDAFLPPTGDGFGQRWLNLFNSFDPRSKAEIQAIAAKHGFYGDQIATVADFLLFKGVIWPAIFGTAYTAAEATFNVNRYNDHIQTLKELCQKEAEEQQKLGKTFTCPEINELKKVEKGEWLKNMKERSTIWQMKNGDGTPIRDLFHFPFYYDDVINGIEDGLTKILNGEWTPKKFMEYIETAGKEVAPQICAELEKYGRSCDDPELNNIDKQLDALEKYIKDARTKRTQDEIDKARVQDSLRNDSLSRARTDVVLGKKESFLAYINAKNLGVDESQKLVAYVWCDAQNTGFAYLKNRSHSLDSDYFCFSPNPHATITEPSTTFIPCEDWQNKLSEHCKNEPPGNRYYYS